MRETGNNIWVVLLLLGCVCLACGGSGGQATGDPSAEANKLVDEANALNTKSDEHGTRSNALFSELLGESWIKAKDTAAYQKANRSKFDEVVSEKQQELALMTEAAKKLEQASQLDVDDKFKEYLGLLVQSTRKQIEVGQLQIATAKSFLQAKDVAAINKLIVDHNTSAAQLRKESEDLSAKADQVSKDNPTIIINK